jgi:hypothetical protein
MMARYCCPSGYEDSRRGIEIIENVTLELVDPMVEVEYIQCYIRSLNVCTPCKIDKTSIKAVKMSKMRFSNAIYDSRSSMF